MPSCRQAWPSADPLHAEVSSASHAKADSAYECHQHYGSPNSRISQTTNHIITINIFNST